MTTKMAHRWQFPVYVAIGLISAAVDILIIQTLVWSGFHYTVGVTFGFLVGFLVNYLGHTRVTFKKQETFGNVLEFILVLLLNYLITLFFVALSEHFLDSIVIGKIASLPVVAVNGFLWGKYWVFK